MAASELIVGKIWRLCAQLATQTKPNQIIEEKE
jgi:hypothetical protein